MMVQSLLRHAMAETISEGFINCLIVTNSAETNVQLSRIHEHLFTRKCFRCAHNHRCVSHFGTYPTPFLLPLGDAYSLLHIIYRKSWEGQVLIEFLHFQSISSRWGLLCS